MIEFTSGGLLLETDAIVQHAELTRLVLEQKDPDAVTVRLGLSASDDGFRFLVAVR